MCVEILSYVYSKQKEALLPLVNTTTTSDCSLRNSKQFCTFRGNSKILKLLGYARRDGDGGDNFGAKYMEEFIPIVEEFQIVRTR